MIGCHKVQEQRKRGVKERRKAEGGMRFPHFELYDAACGAQKVKTHAPANTQAEQVLASLKKVGHPQLNPEAYLTCTFPLVPALC